MEYANGGGRLSPPAPDRNNLQIARLRGGAGRTRTNHQSVMEHGSSPTNSPGRTPIRSRGVSGPETWVTDRTGDMGGQPRADRVVDWLQVSCSGEHLWHGHCSLARAFAVNPARQEARPTVMVMMFS